MNSLAAAQTLLLSAGVCAADPGRCRRRGRERFVVVGGFSRAQGAVHAEEAPTVQELQSLRVRTLHRVRWRGHPRHQGAHPRGAAHVSSNPIGSSSESLQGLAHYCPKPLPTLAAFHCVRLHTTALRAGPANIPMGCRPLARRGGGGTAQVKAQSLPLPGELTASTSWALHDLGTPSDHDVL